jgi:vacuolar-type H+-ATPase subunit H
VDILYLVNRLEKLIANSRRIPLTNQISIKRAEISNIIDSMQKAIPEEIRQARRIIQEKERIIAQAQADASALLARAREETERAMNREGLLRAAEERSRELVRNAESRSQELVRRAEAHAEQMKTEADSYVVETLRALRDHLASIEMDVGRSILSIEKGLESLELPPEEEQGAEGGYVEEGYGEFEEVQDAQAQPDAFPRRASLAVDTMGGPMYDQDPAQWVINPQEQVVGDNDPSSAPPRQKRRNGP